MDIRELFARGKPVFSFEFFLPKAPDDLDAFLAGVAHLKTLGPSFVTLTYRSDGSATDKTIQTAGRLKKEIGLDTACHLTCLAHTRDEINAILGRLAALEIRHIVALRGDRPKDQALAAGKSEFSHAAELVDLIKKRGGFQMAVAGYPEKHPEAPTMEEDLAHLKQKVAAGADWVITQLFFDNADYFAFVKKVRALGITVPIVPGIMPVTNYAQVRRFTELCAAKIPAEMTQTLETIQNDAEAVVRFGIDYAVRQCKSLIEGGAPGIHFYTLNRTHSTAEILVKLKKQL